MTSPMLSWHDAVRCDFTRPRPCGDVIAGYKDVDTGRLSDGHHVVRVEVVPRSGKSVGFGPHDLD